ncbi:unnamed protein product [Rhizopus stolonifer]
MNFSQIFLSACPYCHLFTAVNQEDLDAHQTETGCMMEYIHQQFRPAGQCTENDTQPSEQSNGAVSIDTGVSVSGDASPVNMKSANTATDDEEGK